MTYLLTLEPLLFYPGDQVSCAGFLALWLNEPALWREDYGVIKALNQGLRSV